MFATVALRFRYRSAVQHIRIISPTSTAFRNSNFCTEIVPTPIPAFDATLRHVSPRGRTEKEAVVNGGRKRGEEIAERSGHHLVAGVTQFHLEKGTFSPVENARFRSDISRYCDCFVFKDRYRHTR